MVAGALGLYQTYLTNVVGQKVLRDLRAGPSGAGKTAISYSAHARTP